MKSSRYTQPSKSIALFVFPGDRGHFQASVPLALTLAGGNTVVRCLLVFLSTLVLPSDTLYAERMKP